MHELVSSCFKCECFCASVQVILVKFTEPPVSPNLSCHITFLNHFVSEKIVVTLNKYNNLKSLYSCASVKEKHFNCCNTSDSFYAIE